MHVNASWIPWGALLLVGGFIVRVCLMIWGQRSRVRGLVNGDLTLDSGIDSIQVGKPSVSFNLSPMSSPSGSTHISVHIGRPAVYKLDVKTGSEADIPKALLDSLSPQQRKLVLDKLAEAKRASTEGAPTPKTQQAS
jgi:hypothetical protein